MPFWEGIVSNNIRKYRELSGMSQAQLARAAEMSTDTISKFEAGISIPKIETLGRISDAMDKDITLFLVSKHNKGDALKTDYAKFVEKALNEVHGDVVKAVLYMNSHWGGSMVYFQRLNRELNADQKNEVLFKALVERKRKMEAEEHE